MKYLNLCIWLVLVDVGSILQEIAHELARRGSDEP